MVIEAMDVIQVEPGTVIRDEAGNELTVSDAQYVTKGRKVYCTARVIELLRKHSANKRAI